MGFWVCGGWLPVLVGEWLPVMSGVCLDTTSSSFRSHLYVAHAMEVGLGIPRKEGPREVGG